MAVRQVSEIETIDLLNEAGASSLAVASTNSARSFSFQPQRNSSFALEIQFDSAAAVDVKIEIEHGSTEPGTEGSSDTDFVEGDANSAVIGPLHTGIVDENVHFMAFSPVTAPFLRFLFTGQGSNAASTVITRLKVHQARST